MKRCALLTTTGLDEKFLDDDRLEKALLDLSWTVHWVNWRESNVNWDQYDCAIIRTPWDYTDDLSLFLKKVEAIENSTCRLFNDFKVIRWNSKKTYLTDLADAGVKIVPTLWLSLKSKGQLISAIAEMGLEKLVIKPQVGAGSKNTFLIEAPFESKLEEVVDCLLGVDIMVQPFMENIKREGEHSAHFFNGQFSHMILKKPKRDDFRSQEEFGSEIRKVEITDSQLQFCDKVLKIVDGDCLFARVDFINDMAGNPNLIELELIEPSLYFRFDEAAAPKMALALDQMMEMNK